MTDIQSALGISQMSRLDEFVKKRHSIADKYNKHLSDSFLNKPFQHEDSYSAYHLYVIRLKIDKINKTHSQVYENLHNAGIAVNLHYIPVYRHPYYENKGFKEGYCPEAESYFNEALSIPMYPALSNDQQDRVIEVLNTHIDK